MDPSEDLIIIFTFCALRQQLHWWTRVHRHRVPKFREKQEHNVAFLGLSRKRPCFISFQAGKRDNDYNSTGLPRTINFLTFHQRCSSCLETSIFWSLMANLLLVLKDLSPGETRWAEMLLVWPSRLPWATGADLAAVVGTGLGSLTNIRRWANFSACFLSTSLWACRDSWPGIDRKKRKKKRKKEM